MAARSGRTHVEDTQAGTSVGPLGFVPALDGVRALAIVLVLCVHFTTVSPGGFVGVDLFFVLSGFLITSLLIDERRSRGRISLKAFVGRRFVRLGPALGLVLLVDFLLRTLMLRNDVGTALVVIARPLTFMSNWLTIWGAPLNELTPTWSLSVEEQFYLLWPTVLVLLLWRARDLSAVAGRVLLAGLAVAAWCITCFLLTGDAVRSLWGSDTRTAGLLFGAALALARAAGSTRGWSPVVVRWAGRVGIVVLVAFAVFGSVERFLYITAVIALAGAAVVHSATEGGDRILEWAFTRSALVWVGRRSYGIYLWNVVVQLFVMWLWVDANELQVGLVAIPVTFACAALSFRFLEQPITRRARVRRAAVAAAAIADAPDRPPGDQPAGDGTVIDLRVPTGHGVPVPTAAAVVATADG